MGIDIYMRWKGQTKEETDAQYAGYSVVHGHVGYLREAYHGDPYATRVLVPEAFAGHDNKPDDFDWRAYKGEPISAAVLRERLPDTVAAAIERARVVYDEHIDEHDAVAQAFVDFVELAERKEKETGEPVMIYASY